MNSSLEFDIGPLSWVKPEIEVAVQNGLESLQAYTSNREDTALLKHAENHWHQVSGALKIVGLDSLTVYSTELENQVRILSEESPAERFDQIRIAAQELLHYLDQLVAGHFVPPTVLFSKYADLLIARGVTTPSAADLFFPDLTHRVPQDKVEHTLTGEEITTFLKQKRRLYQQGLLQWLRGDPSGAQVMYSAVLAITESQTIVNQRAFWWCAAGLMEALALENVSSSNLEIKQLCSRIDLQIRRLLEGSNKVVERLHREILYFIGISSSSSELLEQIRATYELDALLGTMTSGEMVASDLATLQPLLEEALALIPSIKDCWLKVTNGEISAFPTLQKALQSLSLLSNQTQNSDLTRLIARIAREVSELPANNISESLAIEVATGLILTEMALENYSDLNQDFTAQVNEIEQRLNLVHRGENLPQPPVGNFLQTKQSKALLVHLVEEIKENLQHIERILDSFFRNTSQHNELAQIKPLTNQINGALRVLGHEIVAQLLSSCQGRIDSYLADTPGTASLSQEEMEFLAETLSAIGFFVESLLVGDQSGDYQMLTPFIQRSLGVPSDLSIQAEHPLNLTTTDALTSIDGTHSASRTEESSSQQQLPDTPDALAAPTSAPQPNVTPSEAQTDLIHLDQELEPLPASMETERLLHVSAEQLDLELLEIYLEEAESVLAQIAEQLQHLSQSPENSETLRTIRRGFHTLKGSGRMVGLDDLSELAWGIENALNIWLDAERPATPGLLQLLAKAHGQFAAWIDDLKTTGVLHLDPVPLLDAIASIDVQAIPERWTNLITLPMASPSHMEATPSTPTGGAGLPTQDELVIGETTLSRVLYSILIEEAGQHLETLNRELQLLQKHPQQLPSSAMVRAAHTLVGIHRAAGFPLVGDVASALEQTLARLENNPALANDPVLPTSSANGAYPQNSLPVLQKAIAILSTLVDRIRQKQEFTQDDAQSARHIQEELNDYILSLQGPAEYHDAETSALQLATENGEPLSTTLEQTPQLASSRVVSDALTARTTSPQKIWDHSDPLLGITDEIDNQLLPLFLEEATELLPEAYNQLRMWRTEPGSLKYPQELGRILHTLKGSARMAGAMQFGQFVHTLETKLVSPSPFSLVQNSEFFEALETDLDLLHILFEKLQTERTPHEAPSAASQDTAPATPVVADSLAKALFIPPQHAIQTPIAADFNQETANRTLLRVPTKTIERLVNEAGEISIARARMEGEFHHLKQNLLELTQSVIRLRTQVREIEIQAETQIQSRRTELEEQNKGFDPLELDRFTNFQELTRSLAEGVNDVATIQQVLLKGLDDANAALTNQARMNRDLQQELMSIRLVPFNTLAERLYRVVRQTAKEVKKRANLEIQGGQVELDRSVLEKLAAPLEHLLRNAVDHGLEPPLERVATQKAEIGEIAIQLHQENNQIILTLTDDGIGLDLNAIAAQAVALGLIDSYDPAHPTLTQAQLIELIFTPGFSTAKTVTQISGRGVGMDVVRNEISSLSGHVQVQTEHGKGTSFVITLPLSLALAQVVLVRANKRLIALPAPLIEQVQQLKQTPLEEAYAKQSIPWQNQVYPLFYLPELLEDFSKPPEPSRYNTVLFLKSRSGRIATHIDEMIGTQEVVVKDIGPQLARVPGITGASVLGTGEIALIMDPTQLVQRHQQQFNLKASIESEHYHVSKPMDGHTVPIIMIVDDSLTVRRIVSRLVSKAGYEPITAKDGLDALQQLNSVHPDVILLDIEMPRMDGFEFARTIKGSPTTRDIPIIMITSRTAEKHRQRAAEIGVTVYLGKPYQEEELLNHLRSLLPQTLLH